MTPEQIAAVCHEANRMYCTVTGDRSQPEWYDAPEWQKISAVQGVQTLIADPSLTPEQMHRQDKLKVKQWKKKTSNTSALEVSN